MNHRKPDDRIQDGAGQSQSQPVQLHTKFFAKISLQDLALVRSCNYVQSKTKVLNHRSGSLPASVVTFWSPCDAVWWIGRQPNRQRAR